MSIIGFWMDNINSKRIDNLIKEKYAKISYELLDNINESDKIQEIQIKYGLKRIEEFINGNKVK